MDEETERLATGDDHVTVTRELTPKMKRLLPHVTRQAKLGYDLAQEAEVDNQSAGSVLAAMYNRDLIERDWDEKADAWRYRLPG